MVSVKLVLYAADGARITGGLAVNLGIGIGGDGQRRWVDRQGVGVVGDTVVALKIVSVIQGIGDGVAPNNSAGYVAEAGEVYTNVVAIQKARDRAVVVY